MNNQTNLVFNRGSAVDEDMWDDSALLKAYDDAIRGVKRRKKIKHGLVQEAQPPKVNDESAAAESTPQDCLQPGNGISHGAGRAPIPVDSDVDESLRRVLDAYYQAGFELGRYLERRRQVQGHEDEGNDDSGDDEEELDEERVKLSA